MLVRVPELTRSAGIKLNKLDSLQRHVDALRLHAGQFPHIRARAWQSRRAIIFRLAALFCIAPARAALRGAMEGEDIGV
jgi:hypothetical protein